MIGSLSWGAADGALAKKIIKKEHKAEHGVEA